MKDAGIINAVMKKYDLVLPVLASEQRRILRSKKRTLAAILCLDKKPSFMAGMAVRLYYMMRNAGMNVAPAAGFRLAVTAGIMCIMLIAGSSLIVVQNYIMKPGMIAEKSTGLKGVIAAMSGDLVIKRNNTELKILRAKDGINEGDEIITGDSSMLLQFENGIVVKIMKRSSLIVIKSGARFDLKEGGMLSRVPQQSAASGYEVHTPDSIITVKGTEFGVFYGNSKTKVTVTHGTVTVKHKPSGAEYDVQEGNETEVNADKKIRPLSEESKPVMSGFSELDYTEAINAKSDEVLKVLKEKLAASDELKPSGKMTLAQIKEKFGKLDEIMLYNGKKYTGVITSRGGIYKILTPSGTISVPARDVRGSRVIQ